MPGETTHGLSQDRFPTTHQRRETARVRDEFDL